MPATDFCVSARGDSPGEELRTRKKSIPSTINFLYSELQPRRLYLRDLYSWRWKIYLYILKSRHLKAKRRSSNNTRNYLPFLQCLLFLNRQNHHNDILQLLFLTV